MVRHWRQWKHNCNKMCITWHNLLKTMLRLRGYDCLSFGYNRYYFRSTFRGQNWPHKAPYLIQLSRPRTFCSPVSLSSVLICVVKGRPLLSIQCAVTHVIRCCAGKLSAQKNHVGKSWIFSLLFAFSIKTDTSALKKIVVRAKNALASVRAERFASTEYHSQHFGQKSSFVTVQFLNTDWERAHPHSGPSSMILPIHLECAYMYMRRWGNGTD